MSNEDSLHLSSTRRERRLCVNHTILRRKYSRAGFTRGYSLGEEAGWREGFLFGLKKGGKFLVNQVFSSAWWWRRWFWCRWSGLQVLNQVLFLKNADFGVVSSLSLSLSATISYISSVHLNLFHSCPEWTASLATEIGFYQGYTTAWLTLLEKQDQVSSVYWRWNMHPLLIHFPFMSLLSWIVRERERTCPIDYHLLTSLPHQSLLILENNSFPCCVSLLLSFIPCSLVSFSFTPNPTLVINLLFKSSLYYGLCWCRLL